MIPRKFAGEGKQEGGDFKTLPHLIQPGAHHLPTVSSRIISDMDFKKDDASSPSSHDSFDTSLWETYACKWSLDDLSFIEDELYSPEFPSKEASDTKWCIVVGIRRRKETSWLMNVEVIPYLSLFLKLISTKRKQVSAIYRFACTSGKGKVFTSNSLKRFEVGTESGSSLAMRLHDCCSADGRLCIVCEVRVILDKPQTRRTLNPSTRLLSQDLGYLLAVGDHSDVILKAGSRRFKAHRCLLSVRSAVISAMVRNTAQKVFHFPDVDADCMAAMLRYIYTGEIPSPLGNLAGILMVAADKYGLEPLRVACEAEYFHGLTVENVASHLMLAERKQLPLPKSIAFRFIRKHLDEVTSTEGWKELARACPHLMVELWTAEEMEPERQGSSTVLVT